MNLADFVKQHLDRYTGPFNTFNHKNTGTLEIPGD